jgi:hypothetical protein
MFIKTNALIGKALNWAVAECQFGGNEEWDGTLEGIDSVSDLEGEEYSPSTNGNQGILIIESEGIAIRKYGGFVVTKWQADKWQFKFDEAQASGPTPLIAAMRCLVASKLGDEVDVPEELV